MSMRWKTETLACGYVYMNERAGIRSLAFFSQCHSEEIH
jgi:hypothetical protein